MRIIYICDRLTSTSGIFQKVLAQAQEWERVGHTVWIATPNDLKPQRPARLIAGLPYRTDDAGGKRLLTARFAEQVRRRGLSNFALGQAAAKLKVDLIYTRELPQGIGLRQFMRSHRIVLEINGDALQEIDGRIARARRRRLRNMMMAGSSGVVFVSNELRRNCGISGINSIVIANPCLPRSDGVEYRRNRGQRPMIGFIGSFRHYWYGIDKVVYLARQLPGFDFTVIGDRIDGPDNLNCYANLTRAESDRIISRLDVGLSSLALHRKGMEEASTLKSRHYLSMGVPIIQAYRDTDIPSDTECVLEISNAENNCHDWLDEIERFVWKAFKSDNFSEQALELASGPLSLAEKERVRLGFLEDCFKAY